ncbi:uncharacterized protein E0L32_009010 [Thyridium curvatum]|uniref:Small ribosomal subunit protein uS10m n=1 Tax=Thyridium curvatum TaxID=1093900 RepID=A0A507AXU2_9PEZI|nr:uncharacterized protein E0L32_009010 [Thyridium curvatum]TPX09819.1 hypothetical protein E0L32_009010 [Thyridium curvatum]
MSAPSVIRPVRHVIQWKPQSAVLRPIQATSIPSLSRPKSSVASKAARPASTTAAESKDSKPDPRLPRSVQSLYLQPLRHEVEYGVPSADLQLRSFNVRSLEFFCDFALRAAYYLKLPAFGPVPLPKITERWTVPKSHFIFKKSQENFERVTLRRLIQIRDGNPETVQIWLAFLQKHAYPGVGMKANMWEFSKLDVGKLMDEGAKDAAGVIEPKWAHLGESKTIGTVEKVEELLTKERVNLSGGLDENEVVQGSRDSPVAEEPRPQPARLTRNSAGAAVALISMPPEQPAAPSLLLIHLRHGCARRRRGAGRRLLGHPADGRAAPGQLPGRAEPVGPAAARGRAGGPAAVLDRRPARHHGAAGGRGAAPAEAGDDGRAAGHRDRPGAVHRVLSVVGARAFGTHVDSQLHGVYGLSLEDDAVEGWGRWQSKMHLSNDASFLDEKAKTSLKLGLFSYPVLQAADILVHRATHVPVGEDQRQHLEFARDCALGFNHVYGGQHLVAPETILSKSARRVMSLQQPTQKMSKSHADPRSRILLTDSPAEVRKKLMSALTDSTNAVSYDPAARPGVANLLELLSIFEGETEATPTPEELAAEMAAAGATLKTLKERVGDAVVDGIGGIRERYLELLNRDGGRYLDEVEAKGAEKARASAEETMKDVRSVVGL